MADNEILLEGGSGTEYKYWIHRLPQSFKAFAGNYIFAKETKPGKYTPIYIGEAEDLSVCFDDHHAMSRIEKAGATHILAHTTTLGFLTRRDEQIDLIDKYDPACNK